MSISAFRKILLVLIFPLSAFSQTTDNAELRKMYEEDQSGRMVKNIDWRELKKNDSIREKRVYELIRSGQIVTGKDYFHSAMIFQHGNDSVAYGMAVKQMKKAIELDTTMNKWLLAAAIDRELMSRKKPQIYGTQYVKNGEHAQWERYRIDSTQVTDEQRKEFHVETLAEQKVKERNMNLKSVWEFYSQANSIDKTADFIKTEKRLGNASEYNVSEEAINMLAYELMNQNKTEDALKLFKLNTELYPTGFNTFDSYGECLLQLNRKEEAIKAYRKSLELNPKNENARAVLNKVQ